MIEQVLIPGGDPRRVDEFLPDGYIKHTAPLAGEPSSLRELAVAQDRPLIYDEIVLLVGDGNFVATLCSARRGGQRYAQVDTFRLEQGRIVEHWANAEAVPPRDDRIDSRTL